MAESGKRVNQRKLFQHSACLGQAMVICKKMASYNFYLNTWRQIKFQRNAVIKKNNYLTFGRAMSGLKVDEPKLSSMLTLRAELKERKCEIR